MDVQNQLQMAGTEKACKKKTAKNKTALGEQWFTESNRQMREEKGSGGTYVDVSIYNRIWICHYTVYVYVYIYIYIHIYIETYIRDNNQTHMCIYT